MADIKAVNISSKHQFAFSTKMLETITSGNDIVGLANQRYHFLKKIAHPVSLNILFHRIETLSPDSDQLSISEGCRIVNEIRRKRAKL